MHTVELLEEAVSLAGRAGYQIRQEWLGGSGGGACQIRGQKTIFLDVALGPAEQLEQVLDAVRGDPEALALPMPYPLRDLLKTRKIA